MQRSRMAADANGSRYAARSASVQRRRGVPNEVTARGRRFSLRFTKRAGGLEKSRKNRRTIGNSSSAKANVSTATKRA